MLVQLLLRFAVNCLYGGTCRYHDGVISNIKAFEADLDDSRHCRVPYCQGECKGGFIKKRAQRESVA